MKKLAKETKMGTFLVVQGLRIHLPMQGMQVRSLVQELIFRMLWGNQAPVPHRARQLLNQHSRACKPQLLSRPPTACAPQREAHTPQLITTICYSWTAARQVPPSMEFYRQEYWSG